MRENDQSFLFTGCAHHGILNILRRHETLSGEKPCGVFGGFHLASRSAGEEGPASLARLALALDECGAMFYTGHCTGEKPYAFLKERLGHRLERLTSGRIIEIDTKKEKSL